MPVFLSKNYPYISSMKKSTSFPSTMSFNGSVSSGVKGTCDIFADFFESVYSPSTAVHSSLAHSSEVGVFTGIGSLHLSCDQVLEKLLRLDPRKGRGPDLVPPLLLRKCAYELSYTHCVVFLTNRFRKEPFSRGGSYYT